MIAIVSFDEVGRLFSLLLSRSLRSNELLLPRLYILSTELFELEFISRHTGFLANTLFCLSGLDVAAVGSELS